MPLPGALTTIKWTRLYPYVDVGCRHSCTTIKLFKDLLAEKGVPMLVVDCDVADSTVTSEEEVRDRLEQFF